MTDMNDHQKNCLNALVLYTLDSEFDSFYNMMLDDEHGKDIAGEGDMCKNLTLDSVPLSCRNHVYYFALVLAKHIFKRD